MQNGEHMIWYFTDSPGETCCLCNHDIKDARYYKIDRRHCLNQEYHHFKTIEKAFCQQCCMNTMWDEYIEIESKRILKEAKCARLISTMNSSMESPGAPVTDA